MNLSFFIGVVGLYLLLVNDGLDEVAEDLIVTPIIVVRFTEEFVAGKAEVINRPRPFLFHLIPTPAIKRLFRFVS